MCDKNLILRKTGPSEYTIYSDKGYSLYVMHRCSSPDDAMLTAKAWASSWISVSIRMEDEQQSK
jgi:hypothetical protein